MSVMGLLAGQGRVTAERMRFDGQDLQTISNAGRRKILGKDMAMIFQDPMTSLNPCFTVGFQLREVLRQLTAEAPPADALALAQARPALGRWLAMRRIWQAGGADNIAPLFAHLLDGTPLPAPKPEPALRLRVGGHQREPGASGLSAAPALVVLDLANMESATADASLGTTKAIATWPLS